MSTRIAFFLIVATACVGDEGSGFEGDWEVVEQVAASDCESPLSPVPIEEPERYFRLVDEPRAGGAIVAYYACASPGECVDVLDLFRSFGRSEGRWETTIATGIAPGCLLRFRHRELTATSDGLLIVERVYEELDASVPDDECTQALARERGDSMACVEVTEITARRSL